MAYHTSYKKFLDKTSQDINDYEIINDMYGENLKNEKPLRYRHIQLWDHLKYHQFEPICNNDIYKRIKFCTPHLLFMRMNINNNTQKISKEYGYSYDGKNKVKLEDNFYHHLIIQLNNTISLEYKQNFDTLKIHELARQIIPPLHFIDIILSGRSISTYTQPSTKINNNNNNINKNENENENENTINFSQILQTAWNTEDIYDNYTDEQQKLNKVQISWVVLRLKYLIKSQNFLKNLLNISYETLSLAIALLCKECQDTIKIINELESWAMKQIISDTIYNTIPLINICTHHEILQIAKQQQQHWPNQPYIQNKGPSFYYKDISYIQQYEKYPFMALPRKDITSIVDINNVSDKNTKKITSLYELPTNLQDITELYINEPNSISVQYIPFIPYEFKDKQNTNDFTEISVWDSHKTMIIRSHRPLLVQDEEGIPFDFLCITYCGIYAETNPSWDLKDIQLKNNVYNNNSTQKTYNCNDIQCKVLHREYKCIDITEAPLLYPPECGKIPLTYTCSCIFYPKKNGIYTIYPIRCIETNNELRQILGSRGLSILVETAPAELCRTLENFYDQLFWSVRFSSNFSSVFIEQANSTLNCLKIHLISSRKKSRNLEYTLLGYV